MENSILFFLLTPSLIEIIYLINKTKYSENFSTIMVKNRCQCQCTSLLRIHGKTSLSPFKNIQNVSKLCVKIPQQPESRDPLSWNSSSIIFRSFRWLYLANCTLSSGGMPGSCSILLCWIQISCKTLIRQVRPPLQPLPQGSSSSTVW